MSNKFKKKDDITIQVTTTESKQVETEWTLETLDHAIAHIDEQIEALQTKRGEYTKIRDEAVKRGVKHPDELRTAEKAGKEE